MSSSTIIGIPTDDKVFESNCVPLFAGLLNDPNVKLLGSRGKKQFGLDLIGRRDRDPAQPVGIQCKLITRGAKLGEATVRKEVTQALTIQPPLTEFYIVTTATDEPALDFLAIELSQEQAKLGRTIDIQVWGWDTLQDKIRADSRALSAFDPDYSASTNKLIGLGTEVAETTSLLLAQSERTLEGIDVIRAAVTLGPVDTERSAALELHLDAQVDDYRDLMNGGKPRTALALLEKLEASLKDGSSPAIRARIKANIAFARMRLGNDTEGADLLAEAYALNPTDPKARANNILSLALHGDLNGAWAFAEEVLAADPSNINAAAMAFQVSAMSDERRDPTVIVPADLLGNLNVRIHRISYLRHKGAPDSWWRLAAETFERFPEDGAAMRMAADALIDAALLNRVVEKSPLLAADRREKLEQGAALMQRHWDVVRYYENAGHSSWISVALNLITAYRALGDLASAQQVSDQMLTIGSSEPGTYLAAAQVAIDDNQFADAVSVLRSAPAGAPTTLALMVAYSNLNDWQAVIETATPERRAELPPADQQMFDVMLFRAGRAADPASDLDEAVDRLLTAWPCSVAAHIAVADIYRADKPDDVPAIVAKAKSLITAETGYSDRVMFAQLSLYREAWDDIIAVLDEYVPVDRPSEPLAWLAFAFANGATRPRTSHFFQSLAPEVIALPRYARLAGAAEHNRGDLKAAEAYLQTAITAGPSDLRAYLLLASTLERANHLSDAIDLLRGIDDNAVNGSPIDYMRLAHFHRRSGDVERGLRLGYRVAASHRDDEKLMAAYPGLIFLDEALPAPIGRAGPAQIDFWFDLEGLEGARNISGVIDAQVIAGVTTFDPAHPLAAALDGKTVGDIIIMPAELGGERRYRVHELKHKYIWLLHDIMATHAARFPDATSLIEMTMKEGDVQPVLDMVRDLQQRSDVVTEAYVGFPIPLSAVAAMARKPVLGVAEHLTSSGINLRTCLGAQEEREEAAASVRAARAKGAVLDTLTAWQLREMGHLAAAKDYFGRLCIPRSTFDDFLEMRATIEANRGREFMTMGFYGDQPWRHIHTPEDTEARFAAINAAITDFETYCEVLPVEGFADVRLENMMGRFAAAQVFDPISLAHSEGLILVSEDLNLRQFAAQQQVIGGAWLQVVLNVLAMDGAIAERDYLIAVGILGAMRHDHLWLDAATMIGMLTLDDNRAFALFEAAIRFMGGRKAEMRSHLAVTLDFMRGIWVTTLPEWQKGRAIGCLLTQLVASRPTDWMAILHFLDADLGKQGNRLAARGHDYLVDWIKGHFYKLDDVRSRDKVVTEIRAARPMKAANPSKRKRRRRS